MKTLSKYLFLVLIFVLVYTSCINQRQRIFTVLPDKVELDNKKDPQIISAINVRVNMELINSEKNQVIDLPTPEKKNLRLIKKREDKIDKGIIAWYGIIENDPGSFVLLSITNNAIAGRVTTSNGKLFSIHTVKKGIHQIAEIDASKFIENKDDAVIPPPDDNITPIAADCPDPATNLDVLVVYTSDAETGAGGADGIVALIYECIHLSNLAYQNSNIDQRLNLVHLERVSYTETGNSSTDLGRLRNATDGLEDVATLRDTYSADLVVLLVESLDYCGRAYIMTNVSAAFANNAFAVVKRSCSANSLSFPHELGHNMGARHDCTADATLGSPYDYNHGYFVSNPADGSGSSWRTIMSYNSCTSGGCTRIPYFSNPNLNYSPTSSASVDAMGTIPSAGNCTSDNRQTLNNTASTIANFRCSSPGVNNVWMKDTWNDTGLEPDPNTAGEDMWRSPYIWVRNTEDASFNHQFQHENPIYGSTNWVYVKLINGGGAATNGNLEVYYANASASLTWPASWTLISDQVVNIAANSTTVVSSTWSSLPGTGHYCLLARWVSAADPMTSAETANIGSNVRNNNNIVWRNVNIVAMPPDVEENSVDFHVQGMGKESFSIVFNDEALFPKRAFNESGEIFVKLDKELLGAWKKGGSKGAGFKVSENGVQIVSSNASLDNILLERNVKSKVSIVFKRNKKTISDKYKLNVKQQVKTIRDKQTITKTIGGISYDIYTYKH